MKTNPKIILLTIILTAITTLLLATIWSKFSLSPKSEQTPDKDITLKAENIEQTRNIDIDMDQHKELLGLVDAEKFHFGNVVVADYLTKATVQQFVAQINLENKNDLEIKEIEIALEEFLWRLLWKIFKYQGYGFYHTNNKTLVDCALFSDENAAVILIFGQSAATNSGESNFAPNKDVFNFNWKNGKCYVAKDPLLGTEGGGGSAWTRLGDQLIAKNIYSKVLLVPLAVGGTSVKAWTVNEKHFTKLATTLTLLKENNIKITHALWDQGASDTIAKMKKEEYINHFLNMFHGMQKYGFKAPLFVAEASYCQDKISDDIIEAQQELPYHSDIIFPGPKTDNLRFPKYRALDRCHFNHMGLEKHADLWLEAILKVD